METSDESRDGNGAMGLLLRDRWNWSVDPTYHSGLDLSVSEDLGDQSADESLALIGRAAEFGDLLAVTHGHELGAVLGGSQRGRGNCERAT